MRANFALVLTLLFLGGTPARAEPDPESGARALERMRGEREVMLDPKLREYATCVVHRLLAAAEPSGPTASTSLSTSLTTNEWEVVVFDGDELALHVLPGNRIAVDLAMARFAKTTDQLAAVIAHELGHALARHDWDEPHSLADEREASRIAQELTSAAGFSPAEGIAFWLRMAEVEGSSFTKLHPSPGETAQLLGRYATAVKKSAGPSCPRPSVPLAQVDLYYADISFDRGGSR